MDYVQRSYNFVSCNSIKHTDFQHNNITMSHNKLIISRKYRLCSRCWWHKQRQTPINAKPVSKQCSWSWCKISALKYMLRSTTLYVLLQQQTFAK